MNGDWLLFFLLAVLLFLLWLFFFWPKVKEAREERQRREAEERNRLKDERDGLLIAIRSAAPNFILNARQEFERSYRVSSSEGFFGQDQSPLVCFGYRVGKTNGRTEFERRAILEYAFAADLDNTLPFLPSDYRSDWGSPLSVRRFHRIHNHLDNMADLRDGRHNFEVAVSHWRADARWFQMQQAPRAERYRHI